MDEGDVALAGLSVLLVFIGAALTIMIEVARGQLERKQRRQERRDDFQRQTMLDLQDALYLTVEAGGSLVYSLEQAYQKLGDWTQAKSVTMIGEPLVKALARVSVLNERVTDEQARKAVEAFTNAVLLVSQTDSAEAARSQWKTAVGNRDAANKRLGELIRPL